MKTADFDFEFPAELIAQVPAEKRDHSRLMVLNRKDQTIEHRRFYDIVDYLTAGDLLVLNNTKVMPANLAGRKEEGGAKVEVLLSKQLTVTSNQNNTIWECLVKPGKRLKVGSKVIFGDGEVVGTVTEKTESGEQIIIFEGNLSEFINNFGEIPLPPYINSSLGSDVCFAESESRSSISEHRDIRHSSLAERYQTVYAEKEGASAAPTAGLHFTNELLEKARAKGVEVAFVTLHTGLATFKPVYAENVEEHKMYSETFEVPAETMRAVRNAKRIIAIGTTSVRTLETIGQWEPGYTDNRLSGSTGLFIYPGYKFKIINAIVTNFHWPRTSLIMLVSAFAGKDFVMRAYREAIEQKYRLFSFGDAMLIV